MITTARLVCLLAAAAPAAAQSAFPTTISAACSGGATTFRQAGLAATPNAPLVPTADFGATLPGSCDDDVLFSHAAFWRLAGDVGCSQFYDSGAAVDQGGITQTTTANSWTVQWPDVDNRGVLDATWRATVSSCGMSCGRVEHVWTLTNRSPTSIALEFYAYTDIDYGVPFANGTAPTSAPDRHIVWLDPNYRQPCPGVAEFSGAAVTSWEIDDWPALEAKLTGTVFAPLSGAAIPAVGIDYTGALGWAKTIASGQSLIVVYRHGHNCLACSGAAATAGYGTAHGVTTLSTNGRPVPGCAIALDVTGPPGVTATLLIGTTLNIQIPSCPQWLLVDPVATLTSPLDASGQTVFGLPPTRSGDFCGVTLGFQVFALVPGEPCFPLQNSRGLALTFGN